MGVASLGKDHTWEINLAARAAWMSYVGEMTQSEIAKRLGVSSARVHRLIQLAKKQGIIRVSIEGRPAECLHLEAEIAARFDLKSCVISPYLSDRKDNADLSSLSVGHAAGQVLAQHLMLPATQTITVDPFGATLVETMRAMPQFARPDLKAFTSTGTLSSRFEATNSEVLSLMELRTGAQTSLIPAPFLPGTPEEWASLNALAPIMSMLTAAENADLFLGQIRAIDEQDEITNAEQIAMLMQSEACSRFLGVFLRPDGSVVEDADGLPRIGVQGDKLRETIVHQGKRSFAVCAGPEARDVARATLKSELVTDLIIDEDLAKIL